MNLTDEDKRWIAEQLERVETRLMAELRRSATPADLRIRTHSSLIREMDAEP